MNILWAWAVWESRISLACLKLKRNKWGKRGRMTTDGIEVSLRRAFRDLVCSALCGNEVKYPREWEPLI